MEIWYVYKIGGMVYGCSDVDLVSERFHILCEFAYNHGVRIQKITNSESWPLRLGDYFRQNTHTHCEKWRPQLSELRAISRSTSSRSTPWFIEQIKWWWSHESRILYMRVKLLLRRRQFETSEDGMDKTVKTGNRERKFWEQKNLLPKEWHVHYDEQLNS